MILKKGQKITIIWHGKPVTVTVVSDDGERLVVR